MRTPAGGNNNGTFFLSLFILIIKICSQLFLFFRVFFPQDLDTMARVLINETETK